MERKMQKKNEEGKIIIKNIPEDLSAFYLNAGWEFVKKQPKPQESEVKTLLNKKER
jgi:hypothetical protein